MRNQAIKTVYNQAQRRAKLEKQIADYLGLPNQSLVNKEVRINYISDGKANIIVKEDWENKVDFDLSLIKK